jgi:predicted dehydrogenase
LISYKFGIIGCGRISNKHIDAIIKNGSNIEAICDVEDKKCELVKKNYKLIDTNINRNFNVLLDEHNLDIVSVVTSSDNHFEIAKKIVSKRINTIIEKPVSLSLIEIDVLIKISSEGGVKVAVCHQNRFNPPVQRLHESIFQNRLGKLFYGVATIRWNRKESYYSQANWRGKWKSDGGALMNQSIHNIDLLIWIMGSPVVEVFGYIDNKNHPSIEVEDMAVALLKFANGSFGIIESSMNTYPENFEETLSIFGEKGTVVLGGKSLNKIVHWNVKDDPIDDLNAFNEEVDSVYGNGHIALYKDFIEAIKEDREPAITLQDGRNTVEVILAIYKSSFEKRPVSLPLPPETSTIMFEGKSFK